MEIIGVTNQQKTENTFKNIISLLMTLCTTMMIIINDKLILRICHDHYFSSVHDFK